jgi:orotidine-5'-phosphate decarboxylase
VKFSELLSKRWAEANSLLCVGLDPDVSRLTSHYSPDKDGVEYFCIDIVDATAEFACAFKPQIAYFAAIGAEKQLENICAHIRANYPTMPIILDAKRG